jgi:hypothetical protein
MQNRPDAPALMDAVAEFLLSEVLSSVAADKALSFKVMIAANLCTVVSGELRTQGAREAAEREGLHALLPGMGTTTDLNALNAELSRRLREGSLDAAQLGAAQSHLMQVARDTLGYVNPRFDVSDAPG